eukprot:scaffold44840_cov176-Amphora_coffeaeformis.AAC.1
MGTILIGCHLVYSDPAPGGDGGRSIDLSDPSTTLTSRCAGTHGPTVGKVEVENSTWTWERNSTVDGGGGGDGGLLTIELQKAAKGVVWDAACVGPPQFQNVRLDAVQIEEEKQRLLLERWQEENPGMDFRDATFNGGAPDPRTFMGGVSY